MKHKIDCTVIGDAMVDFILPLEKPEDLSYVFDGGVTSTKSKISVGGTANVAIGISQLSGKSAFVGKIGNDCFGKKIRNDLLINNVKDCLGISEEHNTGMAITILQPNKERFFVVDRGANDFMDTTDIDFDLCSNSKYLFISGYSFQNENTRKLIKTIIKSISDNVNIVFNPAAPNIAKEYNVIFTKFIKKYVDILILNEKESEELMGKQDLFDDLLTSVDIIALTKGKKGSIVATKNEIENIKAHPTKVFDTTGAGDAYAAVFIYGLTKGWSIGKAGNLASKIAGQVVSKVGTR